MLAMETVGAVSKLGTLSALATHAHEVVATTKACATVKKLSNATARDIHCIRTGFAWSHHPAVATIMCIKTIKTFVTIA
jgi:hypothetical protein